MTLEELRAGTVVAIDVNAGHLAVAVVAADGNVIGAPFTVPMDLAGLAAPARDGRLRGAVSALIATAKAAGARALVIEDLDFGEARADRPPRRGAGDLETRTRPPGQDPRAREPHRPSGRDAASPDATPETTGGQALTKETRRPTRPTAAARR